MRIADPDGLAAAIRGSELEPWLLSGHGRESVLSRIPLAESCLDMAEVGPAMWFRGSMPKDCYTLVYVTACPGDGHSFNFGSPHRDRCLGIFAPGEALDGKTPEGYRHGTLTIPASVFLHAVDSRYPEFPKPLRRRGGAVFPVEDACLAVGNLLGAVEETLCDNPDALRGDAARDSLESELLDRFFELTDGNRAGGSKTGNPKITRRYHQMSLLRDYILSNSHRRIQLRELCELSGLSRRGVEYLFMDLLGVRASAFLLRMRLQGVRRELLSAEPRHGLVKQHALNWGFWHLGRFAADYQMLFGEKPSESLVRHR